MSSLRDRPQRWRLEVERWEKVGGGNSEAAADDSALAASHVRGPPPRIDKTIQAIQSISDGGHGFPKIDDRIQRPLSRFR